jgi:hypothetical protein
VQKIIAILLLTATAICSGAEPGPEPGPYSLNLYGGVTTTNDWDELVTWASTDYKDSYLAATTLARTIGRHKDLMSFEVEGQVVKHFNVQTHWEFNALAMARWEAFCWDKYLDTSLAFGLGASYATEKPKIEIENDGETANLLAYWTLELALSLPKHKETALILRIHHRSDCFNLIADHGGSNALALGVKFRL